MLATVGPSRTAAVCRPLVLARPYLPRQAGLQSSRFAKFSYRFLISLGCLECAIFRPARQVASFRSVKAPELPLHRSLTAVKRSVAEDAYNTMFSLAARHMIAFFNASSDKGEVWRPNRKSGLELESRR